MNLWLDLLCKVSGVILIVLFYLFSKLKVNYFYLVIFVLLIVSEYLVVFDLKYINSMTSVKVVSKIVFLFLVYDVVNRSNVKAILKYFIIHAIPAGIIYYYIQQFLGYMDIYLTIYYFFVCFLGAVVYLNLIINNSKKSLYFFLTVFLQGIAELVFGLSFYIEKTMVFCSLGYFIVSFARYFLFQYMMIIKEKKFELN